MVKRSCWLTILFVGLVQWCIAAASNTITTPPSHVYATLDHMLASGLGSETPPAALANLPSEYLATLTDFGESSTPAPNPTTYGVDWIAPGDLQIAEDKELLNKTSKIIASIQQGAGFLAQFDGSNILNVPFGIKGDFNEFEYQIGFDNIQLHTDYAQIDVVAALVHPKLADTLYFAGAGLKYNNREGFVGNATLALVQDFAIEVNENKSAIIFRGYRVQQDAGTFLRFNCDGIEEISFGMTIAFNPELLVPIDTSAEKYVQAFAQFQYRPASGFLIEDLSITPFYYKEYRDFGFQLDNLALDLDELNTTVGYIDQYFSEVTAAGNAPNMTIPQWTGFYCRTFKLWVGGKYMQKNNGEPIIIAGENIVIDDLGFSSLVSVAKPNMVSLGEGNMGGWSFSMDSVTLKILANDLKAFGFAGLIHIPVLDEKTAEAPTLPKQGEDGQAPQAKPAACVAYSALINLDSSHLELNVRMVGDEDLTIPMFVADVTLTEGSHIYVKTGQDFTIATHLNGNVGFNGKLSGGNSSVKSEGGALFGFQGLMVSNQPGYFGVEGFYPGTKEKLNLGIFAITFGKISITDYKPQEYNQQAKKLALEDLSIELGDIGGGDAMTITSSLDFFFTVKPDGSKQKWVSNGLRINKIEFEGTLPGTEVVRGSLAFYYDHQVYKDGFAGKGYVKFDAVPLEIDMACMFGNTGDGGYKYSYVDVSASFGGTGEGGETNSAFKVYSMVGGYHKNMKREQLTDFTVSTGGDSLEMGGKYPQNKYTPFEDSWGIKGGIIAKVGSGAIVGVRIIYEQYPTEGGQGVASNFELEGLVEIMPEGDQESTDSPATEEMTAEGEVPEEDTQLENSTVAQYFGSGGFGGYIRIRIAKDPSGKTFHAALGVHGTVSPVSFSFYGEYYKDPTSWHLFIGRTERNLRVSVGYGATLAKVVTAEIVFKAYFMIGNSPYMPNSLPPPISINDDRQDMLVKAYNEVRANSNTNIYANSTGLKNGNSIALGAYLGLNVEFSKFVTVHAGADIGFDVLLTRNGPNCDEQGGEAGINDWYLLGQFYAGVAAQVGFKLFGKLWTIFGAGVGLVVQAGAFEPTVGIGAWIIQYKILWVSGQATGTFEFGETCTDYVSTFNPDALVSDIRASSYAGPPMENVVTINSDFILDCAITPNRNVTEQLIDFQTGETENLYLKLELNAELKSADGQTIPSTERTDGTSLVLSPKVMLTPGEEITLIADGKVWNTQTNQLYVNDGQTFEFDTTVIFTVDPNGVLGLSIDDVAESYPINWQEYFHVDEYPEIMLDFGKALPQDGVTYSSRLEVKGSPGGSTSSQTSPVGGGLGGGKGTTTSSSSSSGWNVVQLGDLDIEMDGRRLVDAFSQWSTSKEYRWVIKATLDSGEEEDIIELNFATSKYRTFEEKADHLYIPDVTEHNYSSINFHLESDDEPVEISGSSLTRPVHTFIRTGGYRFLHDVFYYWVPYGACKVFRCTEDDAFEPPDPNDPGGGNQQSYTALLIETGNFTESAIPRGNGPGSFDYRIRPTLTNRYNAIKSEALQSGMILCHDYGTYALCNNGMSESGGEDATQQFSYQFPEYQKTRYPIKLKYYIPGFKTYSSSEKVIDMTYK